MNPSRYPTLLLPTAALFCLTSLLGCHSDGGLRGVDDFKPTNSERDAALVPDAAPPEGPPPDQYSPPDGGDALSSPPSDTPPDSLAAPVADAGPEAGPEVVVAPPEWTPALLPGLSVWLDASQGLSRDEQQRVTRWKDRSSHGNDAHQLVAEFRPAVDDKGAGGLPLLQFGVPSLVNVSLRITDNASLHWGTDDFAVFVVMKTSNADRENAVLVRKNEAAGPYTGWLLGVNWTPNTISTYLRFDQDRVVSPTGVFQREKLTLIGTMRTAAASSIAIRVNGVEVVRGAVPVVDVSARGRDIFIGSNGEDLMDNQALRGGVAEIVAVKGHLSAADLLMLERYLLTRYRLP